MKTYSFEWGCGTVFDTKSTGINVLLEELELSIHILGLRAVAWTEKL